MNDKIKSSNVQYVANGLKYLMEKVNIEEVRKCPTDKTYRMSSGIIFIFITSLASIVEGILKVYLSGQNKEVLDSDGIEEATYNELKSIFKRIERVSFNEKLKITCEGTEKQRSICEDIEILFQFRNFIIHSNSSEIEFTGEKSVISRLSYSDYEFEGKSKGLHDYLLKKKLIVNNNNGLFIDQLTNKKILDFFYNLVFEDFLKLGVWDTSSSIIGIKASIRSI